MNEGIHARDGATLRTETGPERAWRHYTFTVAPVPPPRRTRTASRARFGRYTTPARTARHRKGPGTPVTNALTSRELVLAVMTMRLTVTPRGWAGHVSDVQTAR